MDLNHKCKYDIMTFTGMAQKGFQQVCTETDSYTRTIQKKAIKLYKNTDKRKKENLHYTYQKSTTQKLKWLTKTDANGEVR